MFTTALAVPAAIVIALTAAARIPAAAAELIRACLSLIHAVHELRATPAPPRPTAAPPIGPPSPLPADPRQSTPGSTTAPGGGNADRA